MGRTIPSFRIASVMEQNEWKSFRKYLDKSDRKLFDRMFYIAHLYNSACSYSANPIRIQPILCILYFIIISNLQDSEQVEKNTTNIVNDLLQPSESVSAYISS